MNTNYTTAKRPHWPALAYLSAAMLLVGAAAFSAGILWAGTRDHTLDTVQAVELRSLLVLSVLAASGIVWLARKQALHQQALAAGLHAAHSRFEETFQQFPLSVQIITPEGLTLSVNHAWERLFGGTLEDVRNFNLFESPEVIRTGISKHMRAALDGNVAVSPPTFHNIASSWPFSTHDASVNRWIKGTICPVKDVNGRVTELIIVHEDVTEQKQAREARHESEARKSAIVEAALDCIISMDGEGRVIEWNPSAESTFGYTHDEAVGRLLSDLIIPPALRDSHALGLKRYLETGEGPFVGRKIEVTALRADGTEFPTELAITTMVIEGGRIFSAFLRDLTGAKAAEAALHQAHAELELRVEQRTAELRAALEQLQTNYEHLERLEDLRDTLTGMVVHDLRTPLNSMLLGLQTVTYLGPVTSAQQECLDIFTLGCKDSLGVINDLLDIGKMESGEFELRKETLAPGDMVIQARDRIRMLAEVKKLQLEVQIEAGLPTIPADAEKLDRLLINLLGNAIRFAPHGGIVTLGAQLSADLTEVHFWVRDNGAGIPAEAFERIFEKFGQVEAALGGGETSSGLGLAFCKMVVEAHHGRIWVESEAGQGSLFTAAFPVAD